jgi:hypothetical protein
VTVAKFRVHYQATEPVPAWTAWKTWQSDWLTVLGDHAEFESGKGERVILSDVVEVSQPSRSALRRQHDISWLVNTWICVRFVSSGEAQIAYFNDGKGLGNGHYLSHRKMFQAFRFGRRLTHLASAHATMRAVRSGRSRSPWLS